MQAFRRTALASSALLALALPLVARAAPAPSAREELPANVAPSHYDIALVPDIAGKTVTGTVGIDITVRAPTRTIVLNALDLAFDEVTLDKGLRGNASFDQLRGQATLSFAAPVAAGAHRLTIRYHAAIRAGTLGLFAMDYSSPAGPRRTIATNLEPAMARTVFPGWDQPGSKATFTLTLDVPSDRMAVANMPVARSVALSPTTNRVTFAQSPKMSTYLFFFGIGDWERIHDTIDGTDVGVVVGKGDGAKGRYALGEATRLLGWYNQYFGVRYPLPKLDLVVAPGSIEGGAMENWGAIFYSQRALLFDPALSTDRDRQQVFLVVAHEMAHQWFGDLVTMGWWDDLWLNEGFARWMQTYAADALHPEWRTGLQAQAIFAGGKAVDALPSTHPVVQPVLTATQANQAFDQITYDKGAAVITMLKETIGDAPFREGVRRYMRAHAFGNTSDADLWSAMQAVSGKPILAIERDFTRQPGVPLIRVSEAPGDYRLSEDRFFANGPQAPAPGAAQTWRIPLTIGTPGATPRRVLLTAPMTVPAPPGSLVDLGQTAFAMVLYPRPAIEAIVAQTPRLAPVDQIGLMQNAGALGLAGYAPLSDTLALAARLPADADPVVWQFAVGQLLEIDQAYGDAPGRAAFRGWARRLLARPLETVGGVAVAGEPINRAILRSRLQRAMGQFGDPATVAKARGLLASGSGSPSEAETALRIAAASADAAQFDALLARARAESDPLRKERIYLALAGVEDAALAQRMVGLATGDEVPAGTGISLLGTIASKHSALAARDILPLLANPRLALSPTLQWGVAAAIYAAQSDPAAVDAAARYAATVPEDARAPFRGIDATIRHNAQVNAVILPEVDAWIARQPG